MAKKLPDYPDIDDCCDLCENFKDDGVGFPVTHKPRCLYRCESGNTISALVNNRWMTWCTKFQGQIRIGRM